MPFVLAPNLWRRFPKSPGQIRERERAHGDGIFECHDSPEGLEEVFWKKELGDVYIQKDGLLVHDVPSSTVARLKTYQSLICARCGPSRYLAKNNNLLLRIRSLAPLTPDCCYLVLFRHPIAHSESLLRQHLRFSAISGFALDYMRWLVHHEFGADHRPFKFPGAGTSIFTPFAIEYWLERWIDAYSFLLEFLKLRLANTVPVHYERLCDQVDYRMAIFARVGVSPAGAALINRNREFKGGPEILTERALAIYSELCRLASAP
jgi:hypothetical protein